MIGTLAAILTTLAFLPQVVKVIKTKQTESISVAMLIMQVTGIFLWAIHGYNIGDLAVLWANIISLLLASTVLFYKLKYH